MYLLHLLHLLYLLYMLLYCTGNDVRVLALVIIVPAQAKYNPSVLPNVTQHYRSILKRSKLYMLVGAGQ